MSNGGRILFVDDEPALLQVLELLKRRLGPDWEASFAQSGPEGLAHLDKQPYDVVVTDMRMPDMNGVEFLTEVMRRQPNTARIVLSGYADQQSVMRSLGVTHQYLTKPFDAPVLYGTIRRLLGLKRLVNNDRFRVLAARIQSLPSLPSLYYKLMDELASPDATTESVGDLIAKDLSLTAKLLQLVNSAFFGSPNPVTSAKEAVQILGFSTVKSLAVSIYVFSRFDPAKMPDFPLERLWKHSLATGMLARKIVARAGVKGTLAETAFTAGVLHDIGKLLLGFGLPALYRMAVEKATKDKLPLAEAELSVIGVSHPEVGGYLLGLWGLPPELVDAVAWHHQPTLRDPVEFSAATAVHLANHVHAVRTPAEDPPIPAPLDATHLQALDLSAKVDSWLTPDD